MEFKLTGQPLGVWKILDWVKCLRLRYGDHSSAAERLTPTWLHVREARLPKPQILVFWSSECTEDCCTCSLLSGKIDRSEIVLPMKKTLGSVCFFIITKNLKNSWIHTRLRKQPTKPNQINFAELSTFRAHFVLQANFQNHLELIPF